MPQPNSWFAMAVNSDGVADVQIHDEIGAWGVTAKDFITSVKALGPISRMDLHINSYGGEVFDGFAIYNYLTQQLGKPVDTYNDGIAASIASVIFMAGQKRCMPRNSVTMIHNPLTMTIGNADDHEASAQVLRLLQKNAVDLYASKASGLSANDIQELMDDESYMSAEDCLVYGFATDLVDDIPADQVVAADKRLKPVARSTRKFGEYKMLLNINGPQKPTTPKSEVFMKCRKCGAQMAEGVAFCCSCGHDQSIDPVAQAREKEVAELRAQVAKAERDRVSEIVARCGKFSLSADFQKELIDSGEPLDKCVAKILDKIEQPAPLAPSAPTVQKDEADKFRAHAVNSLLVVSGRERDPKVVAEVRKDVPIQSVHALLGRCLQRAGEDPIGLNPHTLADKALRMAGTGSSDLPAILENTLNKVLLGAYNEAPVTWPRWMRTRAVSDFRNVNLIRMSNFSDIDDIPEGMAFKDGKFSDKKETVSVSTKGKKFTVSRQALINDDLDALTRVPAAMMGAIARRQNKDVYDLLTSASLAGPTMTEDSVALFDAAHSNLVTTSGVVSISSLAAADRKLAEMPLPKPDKSAATQYANLSGRYLITGTKNKVAIAQIIGSQFDTTANMTGKINPYAGALELVTDAYLQSLLTAAEGASAAQNTWYLATDYNQLETFVMAVLQGNETPTVRSENSSVGDPLGISYDIFYDWGVGVADYRGIVRNDGK